MTRKTLACAFLLLCVVGLCPVNAVGAPQIALYFDSALQHRTGACPNFPPGSVIDTLYVAVSGIDTPLEAIEFKLELPSELTWIWDTPLLNGLQIGAAVNGTSLAFPEPVDASSLVAIHSIVVLWNCQYCTQLDVPVTLEPHPLTGGLRAVTSDLAFVDLVALDSWVCASIGTFDAEEVAAGRQSGTVNQAVEQCVLECPAGDGGVVLPGLLPAVTHSPDFDANGAVDVQDYAEFAGAYHAPIDPKYDLYCSDNLDLRDFVMFVRHVWHTGPVPTEPATWGRVKAMYLK